MKSKNIIFIIIASVLFSSCSNLDLVPLSEGSSESWYTTEAELAMSINDLYRDPFWPLTLDNSANGSDTWTDDWSYRTALTPVTSGTITSEWSVANTNYWLNSYKCITRCNTILAGLARAVGNIAEQKLTEYEGQVYFVRACQYAKLIFYFGDVIYYTEPLELDPAFGMSRTDKNVVLQRIYEDFDKAIEKLPLSYGNSATKYATKGSAYGMKARTALWQGDYATARTAAKACMDLGVFQLYPNFANLFLTSTKNTVESVFTLPRSVEFRLTLGIQDVIPRNPGGWGAWCPTWELFCAFLCTDGLPIDKSPLFDPREPFKNRDPRCTATIVEFETPHLGYMYQPHPDSLEVINFATGRYQTNNDTRSNAQYASYTGLLWKKGVDATWMQNNYQVDPEKLILRYADVLLMYAEARIELNDIDQSVLDAINQVRARAYGVAYTETDQYPAVTTMNQAELRTVIRVERRMEFAFEGRRYEDIIRWRIAEKVLNIPFYGMLDPAELREKVVNRGLWFFPEIPPVDEDGIADFSGMYSRGLCNIFVQRNFDASRQYLWPIPAKDILINPNLTQNPNY